MFMPRAAGAQRAGEISHLVTLPVTLPLRWPCTTVFAMSSSLGHVRTIPRRVVLPLLLGSLAVALGSLSFVFLGLNQAAGAQDFPYAPSNAMAGMVTGVVGALIAIHRPGLSIGWIILVAAVMQGVTGLAGEWGPYMYWTSAGLLLTGAWASWLASWVWVPAGSLLTLVYTLFPTGQLLSARWRLVVYVGAVTTALLTFSEAFPPGPLYWTSIPNPAGLGLFAPLAAVRPTLFSIHLVTTTGAAAVCVIVRCWRSQGVERQQIKWFVYAYAVFGTIWAVASWVDIARDDRALRSSPVIALLGVSLTWGSIAISILRYRLFDIDIIINRTLVYGALTAVLAGAFAGLSVLTQRVTLAVTGQESQAAVVLAALVVTALFQPLRVGVQTFVDRRFYRAKYDASHTLQRFANQVRDEVELDRLTQSLVAVVSETMQPTHTSLWLRPRMRTSATDPPERN
jgi:hypothetical protein